MKVVINNVFEEHIFVFMLNSNLMLKSHEDLIFRNNKNPLIVNFDKSELTINLDNVPHHIDEVMVINEYNKGIIRIDDIKNTSSEDGLLKICSIKRIKGEWVKTNLMFTIDSNIQTIISDYYEGIVLKK